MFERIVNKKIVDMGSKKVGFLYDTHEREDGITKRYAAMRIILVDGPTLYLEADETLALYQALHSYYTGA